jgi:hypothetical protein
MKKILTLSLLVILVLGVATVVRASIPEMYTGGIQSVGSVKRVRFHFRYCDDVTQACEWHYFGVDPDDSPPMTADPVNEYTYVQFPTAFDDLGQESVSTMFDLAIEAGRYREGIVDDGVAAVFTDLYDESGVSRIFEFHLMTHSREWYYFGSDPAAYPPNPIGPVTEIANVQFPRDFDLVRGGEEGDWLYDIALQAGLRREGIISE